MDLRTIQIDNVVDVEPYRAAWRTLAGNAPMRTPLWLLTWWEHYAEPGDELFVLVFAGPGGELIGVAPLFIRKEEERRTVRLLGSGDVCTVHSTWLSKPGYESSVARAVTRHLLECRAQWDAIVLEGVDADDVAINATVAFLNEKGHPVRVTPKHSNWRISLPSSWDDYLRMLSKSQRKRCRSFERRFLTSNEVKIHRVTEEKDFVKGFEIMLRLHANRWGGGDKPLGDFSDPRFHHFHRKVALELLRRKQLLLTWIEYEGIPVAAEYQFTDQNAVYSYQAGRDPFVTVFPPGNLSIMASLRFAIDNRYDTFDLSCGDQAYKANWRATPTACYNIRIWPATSAGRRQYLRLELLDRAEKARIRLARRVKSLLPCRAVELIRLLLSFVPGAGDGFRKQGSAG